MYLIIYYYLIDEIQHQRCWLVALRYLLRLTRLDRRELTVKAMPDLMMEL